MRARRSAMRAASSEFGQVPSSIADHCLQSQASRNLPPNLHEVRCNSHIVRRRREEHYFDVANDAIVVPQFLCQLNMLEHDLMVQVAVLLKRNRNGNPNASPQMERSPTLAPDSTTQMSYNFSKDSDFRTSSELIGALGNSSSSKNFHLSNSFLGPYHQDYIS